MRVHSSYKSSIHLESTFNKISKFHFIELDCRESSEAISTFTKTDKIYLHVKVAVYDLNPAIWFLILLRVNNKSGNVFFFPVTLLRIFLELSVIILVASWKVYRRRNKSIMNMSAPARIKVLLSNMGHTLDRNKFSVRVKMIHNGGYSIGFTHYFWLLLIKTGKSIRVEVT